MQVFPLAFFLRCFLVMSVGLSLLWPQQAHATHAMGADLSYTCLGGNQYEISLTFYRDCSGVAPVGSFPVNISSASCGLVDLLTITQVSVQEISPLCPALASTSTCQAGVLPGVEQYRYTGIYTFPANCNDWVISWVECCRNGSITNSVVVPIANGTETYIEATLDNLTVSCNSSPSFTNIPVPYVCEGEAFLYNHGAVDPDGDSLAYELINPLETTLGNPTPVPYVAGFSPTYPISTNPPNNFGFDPLTGQLSFTPDVTQRGIVTILVKQYRNGKLIGTSMRDLQVVVENCTNNVPVVNPPSNLSGGTLNGHTFTVCAGSTLSFDIVSSDPDIVNTLTTSSNVAFTIPGATLNTIGNNPSTSSFSWATSAADVGAHSFILTVVDDGCPIVGRQTVGYEIYVVDQVQAFADNYSVCPGTSQSIQLGAHVDGSPGAGTFSWSPTAGLSDPNVPNPVATINGAVTYTVTFTEGLCSSSDQVVIQSIGDLNATPDATVICLGDSVQLDATFSLNLPPPPGGCGPSANTCGAPGTATQVGNGSFATGTSANAGAAGSPFLGARHDGRTQLLFRASELNAAGVVPGIITEISLEVASKFSSQAYNGFTIRMGCTNQNELSGFLGGLSQVYNANYNTVIGANAFVLTTPYEWDGSNNLVVEFCFDNTSSTGFDHVLYENASFNAVYFAYQDNDVGCTLGAGFTTSQRPNLTFTSCPIAVSVNYAWTPGAGLTATNIANPKAGPASSTDYVVSVNTPGCLFTDTVFVTVTQPPALTPFGAVSLCDGDTLPLSLSGTGLAGSTISWSPVTGLSDPSSATPLAFPTTTTTYTVTATNPCGTDMESITITVLPKPSASATVTDVLCNGGNTGSITATVVGGSPNYSYTWNPSVGITPTVSNLSAGTYGLLVLDQNNCRDSLTAVVNEPPLLTLAVVSTTDPTCNGDTDGSFTVAAGGGVPGYDYSLDGTNFQLSPTFNNQGAGTYTVTARDANGCTQTQNVTLTDPVAVSGFLVNQTDSDCLMATGTFTVQPDGGSGGYEFSLDGVNFSPSGAFTNMAPGSYTVTIRDNSGCTGTLQVNVAAIGSPVATLSGQTNVTCPGGNDGSVLVSGSGGTPPLEYSIDGTNFQPTGSFSNLTAGNYTITVRDANGCPSFLDITISDPPPISGFVVSQTDASCPSANDASFTIVGLGGTPAYEYSINGFVFFPNGTFNNLAANTYTVTIRDVNGCTATEMVTLNEPPPITANITAQTNVLCNGDNTGSFTLSGGGGVAPFEYSLDGLTYQNSGTFSNLAAAPYTVFVRDANGCIGLFSVTITEPPALTGNIVSQTNVDCNGNATGAFTVAGQGGTPFYTYSLDGITFSANGTFSGLVAGPYTVHIRDVNACVATLNVSLTEPTTLSASVSNLVDPLCNGDSTGQATLTGMGGTSPYEYSFDGTSYQLIATLSNVPAGNFTGYVRDANGCIATVPFALTEPPVLNIVLDSLTDVDCNGASTGTIYLSGTGGAPMYSYSSDGVNFQPSGTMSSLPAGPYLLYLQDSNGCLDSLSTNVNEPTALTASATVLSDVSCFGGNDGIASASGTGGTGAYAFSWSPGGYSSDLVDTLVANTYTISLTDDNGCTATTQLTVTEPAPILTSLSLLKAITCAGDTDASAEVSVSGGSGPYSYAWSAGTAMDSMVTNLPAGTHLVTVTDATGCQKLDSIIVMEPSPLSSVVSGTDASCFGLEDATVSVSPSGGIAPYGFVWNNDPTLNTATLTGQPAGNYQVVVTDSSGCTDTSNLVINQPAQIFLATTAFNETCSDANGRAVVTPSGGAGGFGYQWNTTPIQLGDTALNLAAGTYQVIVTDQNGCQDSAQISLIDETAPDLNVLSQADASCYGLQDGSATVMASGGTGTYSYSWNTNPVSNGATVSGLAAGTYIATVDDGQCTTDLTVAIGQPDSMVVLIDALTNPLCNGNSDGSIGVSVTGGNVPYTYQWSTSPPQNTPMISNLPAGTYGVLVQDGQGCMDTTVITLVDPPPLSLVTGANDVLCFGESTGVATAQVSGGTPGYTYQWSNGDPNPVAAGLPAGSYLLTVNDANGCVISGGVEIAEPTALQLSLTQNDVRCFGEANGSAAAQVSGGTPGYQYLWSNGDTTSLTLGLSAGTSTVEVRDQNGCVISRQLSLNEPDPITVTVVESIPAFCNLDNGSATVEASGGTPDYIYSWSTTPGQNGPTVVGIFGQGIGPQYEVTVQDGNGCMVSFPVSVINEAPATADFTADIDPAEPVLLSRREISFFNASVNAIAYLWDFGTPGGISDLENPVFAFPDTGTFTVSLIAFDQNFSCPDTATLSFTIVPDGRIFLPNAFTPNGDGINDIFFVPGEGVRQMEVLIFDRWGRLIRRLNGPADGWDGTNEQGLPVQEGVYTLAIKATLNNGYVMNRGGTVTLLR